MKLIKALSYNIHKGFSTSNRNFVLEKMREAIRTVDPDIVFLQEVVGHHEEEKHEIEDWPSKAQFEYMAHELWEHYAYGKNSVYTKGHHGNALLSKYPIVDWENIDISTNKLEKRGILHGIIDVPDMDLKLHALCLHLNLLESGRKIQIKKVCERIQKTIPSNESVIVAGFFNDWKSKISNTLEQRLKMNEAYYTLYGKHAKTFPSASPFLRLDRIYFRGLELKSVKLLSKSPWNKLSDHVAIFAVFGLI
jgi:endonuclease/exonuclease/phosphatase family metal-dependent hydrolase